jgi:hypothetical protein
MSLNLPRFCCWRGTLSENLALLPSWLQRPGMILMVVAVTVGLVAADIWGVRRRTE